MQRGSVADLAVLHELLAVIGSHDDQRAIVEIPILERLEERAELGVHEMDPFVVGVAHVLQYGRVEIGRRLVVRAVRSERLVERL